MFKKSHFSKEQIGDSIIKKPFEFYYKEYFFPFLEDYMYIGPSLLYE